MSYTPNTWHNSPVNDTPISKAALDNIENGISNVDSRLTTVEANYVTRAGHVIQDEGTGLTQEVTLNFTGAGVTVADNPTNSRTDVIIPGGIPPSTISAQGDLIAGNVSGVATRLPLGGSIQDGQALLANSGAPLGMLWEDIPVLVASQGLAVTPRRTTVNFAGNGVVVQDDSVNQQTKVTIPGPKTAFTAEAHNLVAWSGDPSSFTSSSSTSNGTIYLTKLLVPPGTVSVTKIWWNVIAAASTVTSGANWVGLFNNSGTRLATVAADTGTTTGIDSSGIKTSTFTAVDVSGLPFVWVAFVFAATTPPTLSRGVGASNTFINVGLTAALYRYAANGTGTTLPTTITPGSNTSSGTAWWVAIS